MSTATIDLAERPHRGRRPQPTVVRIELRRILRNKRTMILR